VVREGKEWVQNPQTSSPHVTRELLQFLNRMTAISETLFPDGRADMSMHYEVKLQPSSDIQSIALDIDRSQLTAASGQAQAKIFSWPGSAATQQVLIRVKAGANIPFASYQGVWSIFHMLADADPRPPGSRAVELSKVRRGHGLPESVLDQNDKPIQVRLELTGVPADSGVFDRNFFQVKCPARIAE
jgi:type VI protein secretion system component VasK